LLWGNQTNSLQEVGGEGGGGFEPGRLKREIRGLSTKRTVPWIGGGSKERGQFKARRLEEEGLKGHTGGLTQHWWGKKSHGELGNSHLSKWDFGGISRGEA